MRLQNKTINGNQAVKKGNDLMNLTRVIVVIVILCAESPSSSQRMSIQDKLSDTCSFERPDATCRMSIKFSENEYSKQSI